MEEKSDISKLIEIKKFEQPEDGFFDDFLADFQKRQRSEVIEVSARQLFFERISASYKQWGSAQWSAVAAAVIAVCALAYVISSGAELDESYVAEQSTEKQVSSVAPTHTLVYVETFHPKTIKDVEFVFVDLSESSDSDDVEF